MKITLNANPNACTLNLLPLDSDEAIQSNRLTEAQRQTYLRHFDHLEKGDGSVHTFTLPSSDPSAENSLSIQTVYRMGQQLDARTLVKLGNKLAKEALSTKLKQLALHLPSSLNRDQALRLSTAFLLGLNRFETYKSKKAPELEQVNLISDHLCSADLEQLQSRVDALTWTRQLGNEPANVMTPTRLAHEAKTHLEPLGIEVEVLDQPAIESLGMKAFLSVAKGSAEAPKLIVLKHLKAPDSDERLALIGKGLTYDSGGYSIKPTASMLTMKSDMCGAAAVLGAFALLGASQTKANVVGVIAACENMISGGAYKPGDIISSMAGKSIEINNTDAEGRLTLADAVYYAHTHLKATKLIDICTLTGACVVALGLTYSGVLTEDEQLWKLLSQQSQKTGDLVWRMPCDLELLEGLKSDVADLVNTGPRWGGMMTAGLFVREFAGNLPWMHIDIAGPSFLDKADDFAPQGATGVGAELLSGLASDLFEASSN